MSNPVNVICMKWGDKYDASYVNKLYNMVSRNLAREFRFICLTDDNSGLSSAIEAFDIPKLNLPKGIPERGWTKLVTFSKNIFDIKGQCLFLDLDLIVVDSIDQLFDLSGDFFIIKDFVKKDATGNSSVYRFEIGKFSDVLDNFKKNCVQKGLKQFFLTPHLPKKAKIIIFHGKPNPPEAIEGKSGKWYRRVLPTPWVAEHWR